MGIIAPARFPEDLETVRGLFIEYAHHLGEDLCFQGFQQELETLPGAYGPPRGLLLLGEVEGAVAGCIALKDLGDGVCEMKRLYVRPIARGCGLGRRLCLDLLAEARRLGYRAMRLDTLERLEAALALYRELGFRLIPAYYQNPLPGVVYLQLDF
ncbi:MAG: GNAT family N-acetyltransferase [bacterium]|jgi:ribosomal protein S18 acetylase RimI-like enzyme|nr:GNAT family N-acetyltransferase [bacterium]